MFLPFSSGCNEIECHQIFSPFSHKCESLNSNQERIYRKTCRIFSACSLDVATLNFSSGAMKEEMIHFDVITAQKLLLVIFCSYAWISN